MGCNKIEIVRNDTYTFDITFQDSNGDAIDLTGWTIWFTVREEIPATTIVDDTDALISKEITDGGASGIVEISLTPIETNIDPKIYYYDIQYKKDDGTIKSFPYSTIEIVSDITRSV